MINTKNIIKNDNMHPMRKNYALNLLIMIEMNVSMKIYQYGNSKKNMKVCGHLLTWHGLTS